MTAIQRQLLPRDLSEDVNISISSGRDLVASEFDGRDFNELYALAFSRLTREDPISFLRGDGAGLETVVMLGTDQRDALLPILRSEAKTLPDEARIFDIGCGDGRTTRHFLNECNKHVSITLNDVNTEYLGAYKKMLRDEMNFVAIEDIHAAPIDSLIDPRNRAAFDLSENAFDYVLLLHSIYFTPEPGKLMDFALNLLKPGGRAAVVFADEINGYTGRLIGRYQEQNAVQSDYGNTVLARHAIFASGGEGANAKKTEDRLRQALKRDDFTCASAVRQNTRIYGVGFHDIIAAGFITSFAQIGSETIEKKIEHIAAELKNDPEYYKLAIEVSGRRMGMISVEQPQFAYVFEKA